MRYVMLLKSIFKATSKENQDYYPLKMVIAKMSNFSTEIENYQKFERIKELSNSFKTGDLTQFAEEMDNSCKREHQWKIEKMATSEVCIQCHKKIKGDETFKCAECSFYCHPKKCSSLCKPNCVGFKKPGNSKNEFFFFFFFFTNFL